MNTKALIFITLLFCIPAASFAQDISLVYNLVELKDTATTKEPHFVKFEDYTRANGVMRPGIFIHPSLNKPLHLTWNELEMPKCKPEEKLLFIGYAGLSDGVDTNIVDGVGVALEVNGKRLFHKRIRTPSWIPVVADLSLYQGKTVRFSFVTDDGGEENVMADWALVGEPRIVRYTPGSLENNTTDIRVGGLLLDITRASDNAKVTLTPRTENDTQAATPVSYPIDVNSGLWYVDFNICEITNATALHISTENADVRKIHVAAFQPHIELVDFGTDRSVILADEKYSLCATIKNTGTGAVTPAHKITLVCDAMPECTQTIDSLDPGEQVKVYWQQPAHQSIKHRKWMQSTVHVSWKPDRQNTVDFAPCSYDYTLWPAPPDIPVIKRKKHIARKLGSGVTLLQTPHVCVISYANGKGPLLFYTLTNTVQMNSSMPPAFSLRKDMFDATRNPAYVRVATSPSVAEFVQSKLPEILSASSVKCKKDTLVFSYYVANGAGKLHVAFTADDLPGVLNVALQLKATNELKLRALRGPALLVGDGTTGSTKECALFPGLEFLEKNEPSSSTDAFATHLALRLVPDPYFITIPFMAIETPHALVATLWDQKQKWDGKHHTLSALFASPNFLDTRENHRMQLFIPSDTNYLPPNAISATQPYTLKKGKELAFSYDILFSHKHDIIDVIDAWIADVPGSFPEPEEWPRSVSNEIVLSRHAFLHTTFKEEKLQHYNMIGGYYTNAPDIALLLQIDSLLTGDSASRKRAELIYSNTLANAGASSFNRGIGHIAQADVPYFHGYLDDVWPEYRDLATRIMDTMGEDGGWSYYPMPHTKMLGKPNTRTLGVSAWWTAVLWKWALMSADPRAMKVGRKALEHLDSYRVPRGASGWEVPIAAPDILACIYTIQAFTYAYECTGEEHYRQRAIYWARVCLPFIYLWGDNDKPGMLYASLACYGTTFFTHSWLGVPVQWEGLVYADALLRLAKYDDSYPWKSITEGILVSALYQQVDESDNKPELTGTYPDSWGNRFSEKRPAFLSPEGIMAVLYQWKNIPLHPHTAFLSIDDARIHITAGGIVKNAKVIHENNIAFSVQWLPGGTTCVAIPRIEKPSSVRINGKAIPVLNGIDAMPNTAGYVADEKTLFLCIRHTEKPVEINVNDIVPVDDSTPLYSVAFDIIGRLYQRAITVVK